MRRSWRNWKKHLALTVVACFSSARFGVKRTPSTRTASETFTVFIPSVRDGSWTRRRLATLYFVPAHISSVFSAFSFSRLADIQQLIAVTHCSSAFTDDNTLLRSQCTCSWLSSAKACSLTPNVEASSARSAVYRINNSGPRTEPCGTEHVTWMTDDLGDTVDAGHVTRVGPVTVVYFTTLCYNNVCCVQVSTGERARMITSDVYSSITQVCLYYR